MRGHDPALSEVEALFLGEHAERERTYVFIWVTEKADLSPAYELRTKLEKGQFIIHRLHDAAQRTQAHLRAHLDGLRLSYQPFDISNRVFVTGRTRAPIS